MNNSYFPSHFYWHNFYFLALVVSLLQFNALHVFQNIPIPFPGVRERMSRNTSSNSDTFNLIVPFVSLNCLQVSFQTC